MQDSYALQAEREMWEAVTSSDAKPDRSQYRAMSARFAGSCDGCGRRFRKGADILYTSYAPRGSKVFLVRCGCAATKTSAGGRLGSCGSE